MDDINQILDDMNIQDGDAGGSRALLDEGNDPSDPAREFNDKGDDTAGDGTSPLIVDGQPVTPEEIRRLRELEAKQTTEDPNDASDKSNDADAAKMDVFEQFKQEFFEEHEFDQGKELVGDVARNELLAKHDFVLGQLVSRVGKIIEVINDFERDLGPVAEAQRTASQVQSQAKELSDLLDRQVDVEEARELLAKSGGNVAKAAVLAVRAGGGKQKGAEREVPVTPGAESRVRGERSISDFIDEGLRLHGGG